jgi:salicylate hydroxylase
MQQKVLIVGAGIGGLAASLALLRKGFDVETYERASDLKEIGAGVTMSPNGTRLLAALGLTQEFRRIAVLSELRELRLWNTGQAWTLPDQGSTSTARYGSPFVLMHRADLHTMLADAVRRIKPDAIRLDSQCEDVLHDTDGVRLVLTNGRVIGGDLLVGADGVHSAVRSRLHATAKPRYSGNVFWRGMVPMDLVPERERRISGSWISPAGNVTVYPVRGGTLLNFVGTVQRADWSGHSWTEQGTREECLADFTGWHENVRTIISHIEVPYKWGSYLYETVADWSIGRTTLLGDACHAMPPSLGQGAVMAIEDAVMLARCLEHDRDDPVRALRRYQAVREPRARAVVDKSWAQSRRRHHPALARPETAVPYIDEHWAPGRVSDWYDWIYDYDAATAGI